MTDLEAFEYVGRDNRFRQWLTGEREAALKIMVRSTDMPVIHRAQGIVQMLDKMLELMERNKGQLS